MGDPKYSDWVHRSEMRRVLGGANLCYRASGVHAGAYDIGPIEGKAQVNQPLTVHFGIRELGSGDAVIYPFGKIDWGDGSQQGAAPFLSNQPLTHTYGTEGKFVIHAAGGAQFKYQGSNGSGPVISGSYEACVIIKYP